MTNIVHCDSCGSDVALITDHTHDCYRGYVCGTCGRAQVGPHPLYVEPSLAPRNVDEACEGQHCPYCGDPYRSQECACGYYFTW